MPGRQSTDRRHTAPNSNSSAPRPKPRKQKSRAQNALSIAEHSFSDNPRLKRSRFGDIDQGFRKRQRDDDASDDDGDETDSGRAAKRSKSDLRERYGKDAEYGSDSEGNEWVTGQVDEEDDDSVDSDEAFGESDEERFEGFVFRGSKDKGREKRRRGKVDGGLLDEEGDEEDEELDSGEESDNFKENAVDLATMLDDNFDDEDSEDDDKAKKKEKKAEAKRSQRDESEDESENLDEEDSASDADSESEPSDKSSIFSVEEDDTSDPQTQANLLRDLVAGFDTGDRTEEREEKARILAQEAMDPSTAPAGSTADLLAELDPSLRALVGPASKASKRGGKGIPGVIEVPLAQRQQGRLDRAAAFEKSKETLDRWVDTVKHNRRAEHLVFPLLNQDEASAKNTDRMQATTDRKPFNDLEATIQNILLESGMAATSAPAEEGETGGLALEGAEGKQLTLAEVRARNAELRRAREMLFREEIKAKRIKKIKSKSYRRVHRKERERDLAKQQEADAEAGIEPEEDDQDRLDRLRAEERMGAKHRESKWAKAIKASGRAHWDEDARGGVIDMARREEELKRRIHGLAAGRDDDVSAEEDSEMGSDLSDNEANAQLRNELFRLREDTEPSGKGSKLASMKFMQKAEAARKEQNEAAIAELQKTVDERDSEEESDGAEKGRRRFGPQNDANIALPARREHRNDFEERDDSDAEDLIPRQRDAAEADDVEEHASAASTNGTSQGTRHQSKQALGRSQPRNRGPLSQEKPKSGAEPDVFDNPWMQAPERNSKKTAAADQGEDLDPENVKPMLPAPAKRPSKEHAPPKSVTKQVRLLEGYNDDTSSSGESDAEDSALTTHRQRQRNLVTEAFAGDEAVANFEAEKRETAREERTPSPSADIVPGWGSWAGAGLSKRDKKERKQRTDRLQKQAKDAFAASKGGKHVNQTRKDANLNGVIISEKKIVKNAKYLATSLPHPFESKAQYERSLRVPVGPEWTTKETHQASTKPRVIMGGGIIKPMEKPLL